MNFKLSCYQLKTDHYKYVILCKLMVARKQQVRIDAQKIKRKESKHATTENHQITTEGTRKEERNKGITKWRENN